jgi:hypothetical protein
MPLSIKCGASVSKIVLAVPRAAVFGESPIILSKIALGCSGFVPEVG